MGRIEIADRRTAGFSVSTIVTALKSDRAVLVQHVTQHQADEILGEVAAEFGLITELESQAAFASIRGQRQTVSKYFMTVNRRRAFEFILPHCEGSRLQNIQLASFYCHENTTDGGTTLLLNIDQDYPAWQSMKELVTRIDPSSRPPTATEKAIARAKFLTEEVPEVDDQLVQERPSGIPGVRFLWALTRLRKCFSKILQAEVYPYWYDAAILDFDSVKESVRLMDDHGLLREPVSGPRVDHFNQLTAVPLWNSGTTYDELFKSLFIRKLEPGDLIIHNNLTWAHAASNWTPGSGARKVAAAFA
jgi:hypothetical protein